MTKRYSILQKKLQELESQLNTIFSFSEDTDHGHNQIITKLSDDFIHRMAFFKSLLTAEVASHPSKPHHLQHMSRRLDQLDAAFRDWAGFGNSSLIHPHIDGASTCSCTELCLNDDGEVSDETVLDDHDLEGFEDQDYQDQDDNDDGLAMVEYYDNYKEGFGGGDHEETASFGDVGYFSDCLADDQEQKIGAPNNNGDGTSEAERVNNFVEKRKGYFFGALASGMALGMALGFVMMNYSGCFENREPKFDNFLTPT